MKQITNVPAAAATGVDDIHIPFRRSFKLTFIIPLIPEELFLTESNIVLYNLDTLSWHLRDPRRTRIPNMELSRYVRN
jgi:hypothetical protein